MPASRLEIRSAPAHSGVPRRKQQLLELLVFLFLIVPSMVLSPFALRQVQLSFVLMAAASILRDLALVSLILFFLWRNREPVRRIGWTCRHPLREIILGLVLFIPFTRGAALLEAALLHAGLSAPQMPMPSFLKVQGAAQIILAIPLFAVVAFAEETIFRGYLLLRLPAILRSTIASVLISSVIFALGHGYEGSAGVVTVGVMGLVFALIYLWRGSLVAPMVIHFLQDFPGIVLLPLLKLR